MVDLLARHHPNYNWWERHAINSCGMDMNHHEPENVRETTHNVLTAFGSTCSRVAVALPLVTLFGRHTRMPLVALVGPGSITALRPLPGPDGPAGGTVTAGASAAGGPSGFTPGDGGRSGEGSGAVGEGVMSWVLSGGM